MIPSQSRWTGLIGIAIGNALPLYLVWSGQLQIPDLVLLYLLELVLSYLVFWVGLRPGPTRRETAKTHLAMVLGVLIFGPVLAINALGPVTWDDTTWWVAGVALASSLGGYVASIRRRGSRWREGTLGAFAWRFVLIVVALLAASAGRSYDELIGADWEPYSFGGGWALPAGELLTRIALAVDLSPVIVAAGILCSYRLVSEVLYEVFDIFRDESTEAAEE